MEKFIKVDNENYIKEAETNDRDILKLGSGSSIMIRFEIIEKGPSSSVTRSAIEYEIDEGRPKLEAMVTWSVPHLWLLLLKILQDMSSSRRLLGAINSCNSSAQSVSIREDR
jgi:hypothetical protein